MVDNTQIVLRDVHVRFEATAATASAAQSSGSHHAAHQQQQSASASASSASASNPVPPRARASSPALPASSSHSSGPTSHNDGYAFGFTLAEARVRTVDANAAPAFINSADKDASGAGNIFLHRRWDVDSFAIYWESRPRAFTQLAADARLQAFAAWIRPAAATATTNAASVSRSASTASLVSSASFASLSSAAPTEFSESAVPPTVRASNSSPSPPPPAAPTPSAYPLASHFLIAPLSASALHIQYRPLDTRAPRHSLQIWPGSGPNGASAAADTAVPTANASAAANSTHSLPATAAASLQFSIDSEQASGMIRLLRWVSMHEQWVKWDAHRPLLRPRASDVAHARSRNFSRSRSHASGVDTAAAAAADGDTSSSSALSTLSSWSSYLQQIILPSSSADSGDAPDANAAAAAPASSSSSASASASGPPSARAWWRYAMHCMRTSMRERVRPDRWRDVVRRVTDRAAYIDTFKRQCAVTAKAKVWAT